MKVSFTSLGCAKNLVDTEKMLGALKDSGYEIGAIPEDADIIIVNTCCFIESATDESVSTIIALSEYKKRALIVVGCMAERYREEILEELPFVDVITEMKGDIIQGIDMALSGKRGIITQEGTYHSRVRATPVHTAYLKIAEGCDNHCTYCVIPSIRGPYTSRTIQEICDEAQDLVDNGVRELILIAQDTTAYGVDLYDELCLPLLLKELCKLDVAWIRLHYCYPERITDELIEVIACNDKICKYIDMPIQHSNEAILRKMGRRGSREELFTLINKLRKRNIMLRTTLLVGFPTETDEQFNELVDFVREVKFERLGVFKYSQEDGTPAAVMDGQIPIDVKAARKDEIMSLQQAIVKGYNTAQIGKTIKVLVEGENHGRSQADSIDIDGRVYFDSPAKIGTFVDVKVERFIDYDLHGRIITNEHSK